MSTQTPPHFTPETPDDITLRQQVIYALLMPAIKHCFTFRQPLKEMVDLIQMAYYHETRRNGLKMKEAADLLNVSMRKVAQLSKRLKLNFLDPEERHGVPRRVEFALWAGPLSEPRLQQAMPDVDPERISTAINQLLVEGRIEEVPGRTTTYQRVTSEARLTTDKHLARLDGLDNMLSSVANVVYGRFFKPEVSKENTFARTLSLRVRRRDLQRLNEFYEDVIFQTLKELEEAAAQSDDTVSVDVSILWAPYEYIQTLMQQSESEADV